MGLPISVCVTECGYCSKSWRPWERGPHCGEGFRAAGAQNPPGAGRGAGPAPRQPTSPPPACPPGRWGDSCAQPCQCHHGGTCHPQDGSCFCPPGWTGRLCLEGTHRSRAPCPCAHISPSPVSWQPLTPAHPPGSLQAVLRGCLVPIAPNRASVVLERGATQRRGPVCVLRGTVVPPAGLVSSPLGPDYPQGMRAHWHLPGHLPGSWPLTWESLPCMPPTLTSRAETLF